MRQKKTTQFNESEQHKLDKIQPELNLMEDTYNIKQSHTHKTKGKEKERVLKKNSQDFQKDFQKKIPNINHQIKFVTQKKKKNMTFTQDS